MLTIHGRAFAVMLVMVGLALVAQPAAASGKRVYLADCGGIYGGKVEPKTWDYGCTEVNDITHASWTDWGSPTARASANTQLDDCEPSCAEGKVIEPLAHVEVSRVRTCMGSGGRRHRYYTRVVIAFTLDQPFGGLPAGPQAHRYRQHCRR